MIKNDIGIGVSDFKKVILEEKYYIDKTKFIKEVIDDGSEVLLITRPRRFGKTLNMSMLSYFFDINGKYNKDLFKGLYISTCSEKYLKEMNSYPVVYLSFVKVKEKSYEDMLLSMKSVILDLYQNHRYLLESEKIYPEEKEKITNILYGKENEVELKNSISDLIKYLERYYEKQVILLIDEYDVPLQEAYEQGYYEDALLFMKSMYSSTIKDNIYLKKGILTGVSKISKESIFSDLNNLSVCTVMDNEFTDSFGFTKKDVLKVLKDFNTSNDFERVKEWYDGYKIGNMEDIYNPWSILNYAKKRELKPYWVNTSSNSIIKMILRKSVSVKEKIERLLNGEEVEVVINFDTVLNNIEKNEDNVWGLFVMAGYLKVTQKVDMNRRFKVKVPNLEIANLFIDIVDEWFTNNSYKAKLSSMLNDLLSLNFESYKEKFESYVSEMFSFFDVGENTAENFYHAFVLGMLTSLKDNYYIRSNRESGFGRYDIMLEPKEKNNNAYIMEFKVYRENKEKDIFETIQNAKRQIEEKKYEDDLRERGYKHIYKVIYAFKGKNVALDVYD